MKRGLAEKPEDWKWGSYCHYLTGTDGVVEIESHWTGRRREKMGVVPAIKPIPDRSSDCPTLRQNRAKGWATRPSSEATENSLQELRCRVDL